MKTKKKRRSMRKILQTKSNKPLTMSFRGMTMKEIEKLLDEVCKAL